MQIHIVAPSIQRVVTGLTQRLLADIRSLGNAAASLPCQSMTAIAAKLILPSRHTEYTCNQKHMTYQKKKKKKKAKPNWNNAHYPEW
jgi:hypothetical protein